MKFRRTISLITATLILASNVAFAEALRFDYTRQKEVVSKRKANDIIYHDFTDVNPGGLPVGITTYTSQYGSVTTVKHDVGEKTVKNCLVVSDTDHTKESYGAPKVIIPTDSASGLVGIEMRMKYMKTGDSNWNSLVVQFNGTEGLMSRIVCSSASGRLVINTGGANKDFEGRAITVDGWYTVKVILDFNNQEIDMILINETTGEVYQKLAEPFNLGYTFSALKNITIYSTILGGDWIFDYVSVSKESERPEMDDSLKGVPANRVAGPVQRAISDRVNIKLENKYKYTTSAPYISAKDNVMITVRNVAAVFSMACYETTEGYVIKNMDNEFVFAKDGSNVKLDGKVLSLSENGEIKDGQLFVSLSDIATALGYQSNLDKDSNTLFITMKK